MTFPVLAAESLGWFPSVFAHSEDGKWEEGKKVSYQVMLLLTKVNKAQI